MVEVGDSKIAVVVVEEVAVAGELMMLSMLL